MSSTTTYVPGPSIVQAGRSTGPSTPHPRGEGVLPGPPELDDEDASPIATALVPQRGVE